MSKLYELQESSLNVTHVGLGAEGPEARRADFLAYLKNRLEIRNVKLGWYPRVHI